MATQNPNNLNDLNDIITNRSKQAEDLKNQMFGALDNVKEFAKTLAVGDHRLNDLYTTFTKVKNTVTETTDIYARLGSQYVSSSSVAKDIRKTVSDIAAQEQKLTNLNHGRVLDRNMEDAILNQIANKGTTILTLQERLLKEHITLKRTLEDELESRRKVLPLLSTSNDEYDKMVYTGSALKKIFEGISRIPVLGGLINWRRVSEEIQKINLQTGQIERIDLKLGINELGKQLKILSQDPLIRGLIGAYIFKKLYESAVGFVKIMAEVNKDTVALSNNIGTSNEAGKALYNVFYETTGVVMRNSDSLVKGLDASFISIRNMKTATLDLQQSLGTSAMFTNKMVESQIFMTKQMHMSSEEAAGIQKYVLITGKASDNILQSIIKQNTASISYKKILKEVSTISAELSMRFGNDPEKIAKAVVQANKLGMSLEETRKISSSLLNFEQSIEGELESELLLGRQFNFEKARELALMGKSSEAAGELLGQIGGINALEKMNVIQRERVAAAIGLSSDELSKAAIEQEVLSKLGIENNEALKEKIKILQAANNTEGLAALQQEAAKVRGGEVLLQDIAKANIADKFEETMNRIKDILTALVSNSGTIKTAFVILAGLAAAFAASMVTAAIASVIASSAISGGALGGIAIGAGLLTAGVLGGTMYAVNDFQQKPDGTVIMSPEGTFKPNKKDYITASTNPPFQGGGGGDDSAMLSKLDLLIQHTAAGKMIKYDTITAGTAHGMSYNSYA